MPRTPRYSERWGNPLRMIFTTGVSAGLSYSRTAAPQGVTSTQGETWVVGLSAVRLGVTTVNGEVTGVSGALSFNGPVPLLRILRKDTGRWDLSTLLGAIQ